MKRKVLITASWIGAAFMILSVILSPFILLMAFFNDEWYYPLPFITAVLSALIAAVCANIGRTPKIWGLISVVGFLWLVPLTFGALIGINYYDTSRIVLYWLLLSLPGFICIAGGLTILILRKKQEAP